MDTEKVPRDAGNWAAKVDRLTVPADVSKYGYNIDGRRVAGPQQGFGRLWQRSYSADLGEGVSPEELIADWRAHFGEYWPRTARFYSSAATIQPGDVAPLGSPGLASGILVIYADDTSFTFLTPEGHMFAGLITFSAERSGEPGSEHTVAQIRILLRCSDPIFESMWPILRPSESYMWTQTLRHVAVAHGVGDPRITQQTDCVDRRRLWRNWRNVRDNAGIHTARHALTAPFRRRSTDASV